MSTLNSTLHQKQASGHKSVWYIVSFLLIAVIGLTYVKWYPYYNKTILAATTHSIGDSFLGDLSTATFSWNSAWDFANSYFQSVWKAAVLGILLGSLVQVLLPAQWLLKVLGKTSFGSTAIAGIASIPGMMCTCCAAPIAVGLRKKNVSVGASLAFWLGNPTINPATLIFMTFVLSWKFTLLRLFFGLILVFGVSYLGNRFGKGSKSIDVDQLIADQEIKEVTGSFMTRWLKSLGSMILYIVPAYILSVLLLGAAKVWLFPEIGTTATTGIIAIILFAITGMLFVIPTAAEIPIIQSLIALGLGSGPAAALLITLPAISLPSILLVGRSFPKRVLAFVILSVVILGILCGIVGSFIL